MPAHLDDKTAILKKKGTEPIGSVPFFVGESMCLQNKAFASLLKKAAKLENLIVRVRSYVYRFPKNGARVA